MSDRNPNIPGFPSDLLRDIHEGRLSLEEAETIFDLAAEAWRNGSIPDWGEALGFSWDESTAYLHGGGIDDLVRVRFEGWPPFCYLCGGPIDYEKGGWWFVPGSEVDLDGEFVKLVVCPYLKLEQLG